MTSVFLKILNMGIVAGWIALLVMLVRLPLKKAPRFITVLLWALVAVRLIFPFSPESPVSLVPDNEPIPANIFTPEIPEDPSPDAAVYPTESAWVYLFDSADARVSVVSAGDIEVGDMVFMRSQTTVVRDLIIVR